MKSLSVVVMPTHLLPVRPAPTAPGTMTAYFDQIEVSPRALCHVQGMQVFSLSKSFSIIFYVLFSVFLVPLVEWGMSSMFADYDHRGNGRANLAAQVNVTAVYAFDREGHKVRGKEKVRGRGRTETRNVVPKTTHAGRWACCQHGAPVKQFELTHDVDVDLATGSCSPRTNSPWPFPFTCHTRVSYVAFVSLFCRRLVLDLLAGGRGGGRRRWHLLLKLRGCRHGPPPTST